jgi:hypothetical protein
MPTVVKCQMTAQCNFVDREFRSREIPARCLHGVGDMDRTFDISSTVTTDHGHYDLRLGETIRIMIMF